MPTAFSEGGTAKGVTKTVASWGELTDALADTDVDVVQLGANGIYPWGNVRGTLYVERTVTLDLNGYVIEGDGGGVYVAENATFTMNGGMIRECVSRGWDGGGVVNKGRFIMNGGAIQSCAAVTTGGAIYSSSGAPLSLNGAITSDNSSNGQPVYA